MENTNQNSTVAGTQPTPPTPPQTLDYGIVCQIVGHLYIEVHNSKSSVDGNYGSIIENLTTQISELIEENENLKEEMSQYQPDENHNLV